MITPWSTNAVEITQNMDIDGISRIEMFVVKNPEEEFDPMLNEIYEGLDQTIFDIHISPEPINNITDIAAYNQTEGLALNKEEVAYLEDLSKRLGRSLTDSEVFGFSQVNSEHCRHKIFNGRFVIDGLEQEESLFQMIKKTSKTNPNSIVSAYKGQCCFCIRSGNRAVCSKRWFCSQCIRNQYHQKCHITQGRNPQFSDNSRAF